jgi:hypothetical protein
MFRKLGKGIGGILVAGGIYSQCGDKKVTTGAEQKPPALT